MQQPEKGNKAYLSFDYLPIDETSKRFLMTLFQELGLERGDKIKLRQNYLEQRIEAFERTLSSIIVGTNLSEENAVYHSSMTESFTDEPVSYRVFMTIITKLIEGGYVVRDKGHTFYKYDPDTKLSFRPQASHFFPTEKLIKRSHEAGILPERFHDLFKKENSFHFVKVRHPSERNGKHLYKGKLVPQTRLLEDPGHIYNQRLMKNLNNYLWSQKITGTDFNGLYRGFNNYAEKTYMYDQGGRLYTHGCSYQSLSKEERSHIRINDEATVEIDIKASHLSILHGFMNLPIPTDDPYELEEIPRPVVKQWMTISLSQAKPLKQWPSDTRKELVLLFEDLDKWTAPTVGKAALNRYPFLENMNDKEHGWANLQFKESSILISAMLELKETHDVPSLPVHDSLIVPETACDLTQQILKNKFKEWLDIDIQLEVYG